MPRAAVLALLPAALLAACGSSGAKHSSAAHGGSMVVLPTGPTRPPPPVKPAAPRRAPHRAVHGFHPTSTLITHGPRSGRDVALTFDADMTQAMLAAVRSGRRSIGYDPEIVRELRASHTQATIFMTGLWPTAHPAAANSLAAGPLFEIENHSYDHAGWEPPCYGLPLVRSETDKRREVADTTNVLTGLIGGAPHYFRFPGGCHTA